jgi:hypothetical protein
VLRPATSAPFAKASVVWLVGVDAVGVLRNIAEPSSARPAGDETHETSLSNGAAIMKKKPSKKKPSLKLTKQTIKNLRVKSGIVGGRGVCSNHDSGCY